MKTPTIVVIALLSGILGGCQTPPLPYHEGAIPSDVEKGGELTWHANRVAALAEATTEKRDVFVYAFDSV